MFFVSLNFSISGFRVEELQNEILEELEKLCQIGCLKLLPDKTDDFCSPRDRTLEEPIPLSLKKAPVLPHGIAWF